MIKIYTDGSSENPGKSVSGFVAVKDDKILWEDVFKIDKGTSVRAELKAVLMALTWAEGQEEPCTIYTDSQYCRNGYNEWMRIWAANKWEKANGEAPSHLDLWQEVNPLRGAATVKWVRGHNGDEWNEYIDQKVTIRNESRRSKKTKR